MIDVGFSVGCSDVECSVKYEGSTLGESFSVEFGVDVGSSLEV